jgi:hypothetical protein
VPTGFKGYRKAINIFISVELQFKVFKKSTAMCLLRLQIEKYLSESEVTYVQGVSEIGALILTGNRTHQKEQLFSLPFWRKTLRNGLKN